MKRLMVMILSVAGMSLPLMAETAIGFKRAPMLLTEGVTAKASCPAVTELPAPYVPAFHLDASVRTGWQYSGDGSVVWKIPSLVGERYLTTNQTDASSWTGGWTNNRYPKGAILRMNEEKTGITGPYLDFGAEKSQCGLFFNPDSTHLDDSGRPLNDIVGIGTVIAVMDSTEGGGMLLGGGWKWSGNGSTFNVEGFVFARGSGAVSTHAYAQPITPYQYSSLGQSAVLFHDGLWPTAPFLTGYSGGWEVVALVPSKADIPATGVGIGRTTTDLTGNGAQRIAEMLIYTNRLNESQCNEVAAYLRKKWFGVAKPGSNGLAESGGFRVTHQQNTDVGPRTGAGVNATIAVENSNETLTVDRIRGGRRGGTLTKSGAGRLAIRTAETYGGTVKVRGGTLGIVRRTVPAALPSGAVLHLDASDEDSLTCVEEGGVRYVSNWASTGDAYYSVAALSDAERPVLRTDQFADGKACVDFGLLDSGCMMKIRNGTSSATIKSVQTILYVAGVQNGGGTIFGSVPSNWSSAAAYAYYLDRGSYTGDFASPIFFTQNVINQLCSRASPYSGIIYLNGERANGGRDTTKEGYAAPAWQTFAANVPAGWIETIGGTYWPMYRKTGGMRIAELVVYDRTFTTRELEDASAYLAKKWFGRLEAGYVDGAASAAEDVATVVAAADTSIEVASGSARIRSLSTNETASVVTKTGAGRLDLQIAKVGSLVIAGGTVRAVPEPDVGGVAEVAAGAALRLDASDTNHMEFVSADGIDYIKVWRDPDDVRNAAHMGTAANRPWLNTADTCNGLPVVDFGAYGSAGAGAGRFIHFARPLDNVRSLFMVVRIDPAGYAPLLGYSNLDPMATSSYHAAMDFTRHQNSAETGKALFKANGYSALAGATVLTNGVAASTSVAPCGDYMLVEVYPTSGAYASAIAYESGADVNEQTKLLGGIRVGEMIAYERVLSDREKVATRNYLMRKWFAKKDAELTPLPDAKVPSFSVGSVSVAAGAHFEMAAGTRLAGDFAYTDGSAVRVAITADAEGNPVAECLNADGAVTFGENLTLDFSCDLTPEQLAGRKVKVIAAESLVNAEALGSIQFPAPYGRLVFKVRNGDVYVADPPGLMLIFR